MPDIAGAVDNLIKAGWSDEDIQSTIKGIEDHTTGLINAGKTDQEIENTLIQTKILGKDGKPFNLFNNPAQGIVNEGLSNIPISTSNTANKVLQSNTVKASDVKEPSFLQKVASGPVGAVVEGTLRKLTPFPGLTRAIEGTGPKDLSSISNPLPEVITDPIARVIEGIKKIDPGSGKLIEDTMVASPAMHGITGGSIRPAARIVGNKVSNILSNTTGANFGQTASKAPSSPVDALSPKTEPLPYPTSQTSSVVNPSASNPQPRAATNVIDPITIEYAKQARDYGTKIGNADIIARANKILDDAAIPEFNRLLTPEDSAINGKVAIEVAATAKKYAEDIGDPLLLNRANQIINNNGIIRPSQILNPSIHDLENFTANLNVIGNRKADLDMAKLEGTKVVNPDGTPKEVYTGTPSAYDKFDSSKVNAGMYNSAGENIQYFTEEPAIAGGKVADPIIDNINGKIIKRSDTTTDFGYATPRIKNTAAEEALQAPNVRPAYVNIKNPFDIEAGLDQNIVNQFPDLIKNKMGDPITNGDLYNDLVDTFKGDKAKVNQILKDNGYDGITHIGGSITGNAPHRVWISFDPENQVVSKFDPTLYSFRMRDMLNKEPAIVNGKAVEERIPSNGVTGLTQEQVISKFDYPDYTKEEYDIGDALIKRAIDEKIEGMSPLKEDIRDYLDLSKLEKEKLEREKAQVPSQDLFANVKKGSSLEVQTDARILPYDAIMLKIEADTGLPVFNEFYYKGRINYNRKMDFLLEQADIKKKIFGNYTRPFNKYIEGRERISDILEDVLSYNPKTEILEYKDSKGDIVSGKITDAIMNRKWNPEEATIAAKLRDFYEKAYENGAPIKETSYREFYNPKRYENDPNGRTAYFDKFRDNEKAFFAHYRTGSDGPLPLIRDASILFDRYINEWATVNHMLKWQNEIARPLLERVANWKNPGTNALSTDKPARYIEKYIRDVMGIPRDAASDTNYTAFKIIRDNIEPHAPKLAKDLYSWLSKDRTAEVASSKLVGQMYKNVLGYRPIKMVRNGNQRLMAIPLMPNGLTDITRGTGKLRTKAGQDKVLASGILGYVGDMTDKGVGSKIYSPMRGWEAMEKGNRGSIYLSLHDGLINDYKSGMSVGDMAKKYHLNLYHEVRANKIKELYKSGKIGDVRTYGLVDNAAHYIGDAAQAMTQYWYDRGSGVEIFNSGPIAKQMGAFGTYPFLTKNYLSNLFKDAWNGPNRTADLARIMKMMVYVTTIDNIIYNATGINLGSNPLTNLPSQLAGGPVPTGAYGAWQVVSGTLNNMFSNMFQDRDNEYAKMQASEGWRKIKNSTMALTPAIISAPIQAYQSMQPSKKEQRVKSIAP